MFFQFWLTNLGKHSTISQRFLRNEFPSLQPWGLIHLSQKNYKLPRPAWFNSSRIVSPPRALTPRSFQVRVLYFHVKLWKYCRRTFKTTRMHIKGRPDQPCVVPVLMSQKLLPLVSSLCPAQYIIEMQKLQISSSDKYFRYNSMLAGSGILILIIRIS